MGEYVFIFISVPAHDAIHSFVPGPSAVHSLMSVLRMKPLSPVSTHIATSRVWDSVLPSSRASIYTLLVQKKAFPLPMFTGCADTLRCSPVVGSS